MKKIIFFFTLIFFLPFNAFSNEIAIVDITYLLKNSNKGKSIQKQLDNLRSKNEKNFSSKKKILEDKEKEITSKKNVLSEEDFKKRVVSFQKEVNQFNNERRKTTQTYNKDKNIKIAKLLDEINKILVKYSKDNSISTIIDKKNVIITKQENDITKKIMDILNK